MKKLVCGLICLGFAAGVYATDARVISMGTHDAFFLDLESVFRNPANLNLFPNIFYGSYGIFDLDDAAYQKIAADERFSLQRLNQDPRNPFFGGILSYSLNQSTEVGSQYPMISVGGMFNRNDKLLKRIPMSDSLSTYAEPVGKIDAMLAYTFVNGTSVGAGAYAAFQNDTLNENVESSLYRGNLGVNWPVTNTIDLQVNAGVASVTAIGVDSDMETIDDCSDGDISLRGEIRVFSALTTLNGDLVPHISFENISLHQENVKELKVDAGLGLNLNIDKGFFWMALEMLYEQEDAFEVVKNGLGGRISAGWERNLVWDWLVWRIGTVKELVYVTEQDRNTGYWRQNADNDGTDGDHVHFGFGLNIDNRFRVDGVVAEDIFYTFTNLISGPQHHFLTRVSATYSF